MPDWPQGHGATLFILFERRTGLVEGIYQARPLAVTLERLLLIFGWRDAKALFEVPREVPLAVEAYCCHYFFYAQVSSL